MDEERMLEDFTDEEIQELESEDAKGNKFLDVETISKLINFTEEELAEIQADADDAYAEALADFEKQGGK